MVKLGDGSVRELLPVQNACRISPTMDGVKLNSEVAEKIGKFEEAFPAKIETKIYKRRWLQLGLFFVCSAVNFMQWTQFTIIGNIVSRYYEVSLSAVDWTSIIFFVTYLVLVLPASYVMDHIGLRWSCLIGAIGTSIGAWIKFFSVSPDRFAPAFAGQAIVASSQIFILNAPQRLSAVWFDSKEVATATAIGCFGGLAGVSLIFLITPIIVKNHESIEDIGEELSTFSLAVAMVCTVVTLALFLFFQDKPRLPPSEARALQKLNRKCGSDEFFSRFRRLLKNKNFLLIWNTYGMNVGFLNAAAALLNPLYLAHFQNGELEAGRLGFLMGFVGNFGAIVFGMILDKTKKFKAFNVFLYIFTIVGEILFAVGLIMEIKWLVFVAVGVIGTFAISYTSIGLELSAEATYPEPEEMPSALLNAAQQLYGMVLALIVGNLLRAYGATSAHACLIAVLALGLILTILTKDELRRQNAGKDAHRNLNGLLKVLESDEVDKIKDKYIPD